MTRAETKEYILNTIRENAGCRRRDLDGWGSNRVMFMCIIDELKDEGKIREEIYSDPAQMEYYYKYYAI